MDFVQYENDQVSSAQFITSKSYQHVTALTVREITKSTSTFSATNISSNIVWLLQLHDTIQTKSHFGTEFRSIYLAKWEKRLVFRLSFVNLQRTKDGTHMFDAKYNHVFVV